MKQIALTDKTGDYSRKLDYICKHHPKMDKKAMTYSRVIRELIEEKYYQLQATKDSVVVNGTLCKWGDEFISGNGYEFYLVKEDGIWGLVDEGCTFCPLDGCDLSEYQILKK